MLIEGTSKYLLKKTRAKAKMVEYDIPEEQHIFVEKNVEDLFLIAVGAIGNISAAIMRNTDDRDSFILQSKSELEFASKFFDAYLNSQLDTQSDDYNILLGAVAYFLCDYLGSSKVLANKINTINLDLGAEGIENALSSLLQDTFVNYEIITINDEYKEFLKLIQYDYINFFEKGVYPDLKTINTFRKRIYDHGSDLELLLVDSFCAIYYLKIQYSAINLLPEYTGLERSVLHNVLFANSFIKELWPSQRQLGESGVFNGKSAVIQMPTSSGKTKSISIIIASAFLSGRTKLAVIVAPFRALCREISSDLEKDFIFDKSIHIDELSDILQQEELSIDRFIENEKIIIIATPEKLIYLLRKRTDLAEQIGLIIFDEGHLFDEPSRGITYELLISTIKGLLKGTAQKILVSAIIPNAVEINDWLNNEQGTVIADNTIKSTQKNIAITDWSYSDRQYYGYLYFINPENPDEEEFYVPRLIPITQINKLNKERNMRKFPDVDFKNSKVLHNDTAIYYGLTLCKNGGVVIFCGTKDTANNILKRILDIENRGYDISPLFNYSNQEEVFKICKLIEQNYGKENVYYLAGLKSSFVHHSGISNGIKISIEYAMRKGYINFLICTSTLAQGVNLPIRYLVISNIYQGKDPIRVRDFHNLIGRAGRSGLYTEGSILLTETFVYNNRNNYYSTAGWKWRGYKHFIDSKNSEACSSRILFLIKSYNVKDEFTISMKEIISFYYSDNKLFSDKYGKYLEEIRNKYPTLYDEAKSVIEHTLFSLGAIESFLMAYLLDDTWEKCKEKVENVIKHTFAYHLATTEEKVSLLEVIEAAAKYCIENISNTYDRYVCSRSLLSVNKMLLIKDWVEKNVEQVIAADSTDFLLSSLFPIISILLDHKLVRNLEIIDALLDIAILWKNGKSYIEILKFSQKQGYQISERNKLRKLDLDDIIRICDNVISYDSTVILSAISEVVESRIGDSHSVLKFFKQLSSELKYGLIYGASILFYELGFSDRVVAQEIAEHFNAQNKYVTSKSDARKRLKKNMDSIKPILKKYPSVYLDRLIDIV